MRDSVESERKLRNYRDYESGREDEDLHVGTIPEECYPEDEDLDEPFT